MSFKRFKITVYFFNGNPLPAYISLIANEIESALLLALAIFKDSAPIAE